LISAAADRADASVSNCLNEQAVLLETDPGDQVGHRAAATNPALNEMMLRFPDRHLATKYDRELVLVVDPVRARFSSWYEFFPRSTSREPGKHGTFADCEARLPYVAELGFDVLYFPPIHPIGTKFRKGKNNSVTAADGDVGSPWAIGSAEGGHKAIH